MVGAAALIVAALTAPRWLPSAMTVAGIIAILAVPILLFGAFAYYVPLTM